MRLGDDPLALVAGIAVYAIGTACLIIAARRSEGPITE